MPFSQHDMCRHSIAGSLCVGAPADALDLNPGLGLNADVKVTAGLDPETKQLIEDMPADIRQQTIALLEAALSLADKSVTLYLDKVDVFVMRKIKGHWVRSDSVEDIGPTGGPPWPVFGTINVRIRSALSSKAAVTSSDTTLRVDIHHNPAPQLQQQERQR
ncbi:MULTISPECIES: hypothetical protein [Paraburkholderia]|uniref:Uncharacterized protein n=1 Tax=Paraburkholderia madseniana TaxID=2599607 RepID=A0AAP5BEQ9_9BURK|nr:MULTISPECIES: hypothetical protein [Paraburkholderia]MCX4146893.1 hypothetical protein [Paraburkholderia madseniana]MDN7149839.1 hypothetical protein [Paraburkholderia sp. WS6]MDQ6408719.1 hypothetical protein [Paraburkholderia madseniana]